MIHVENISKNYAQRDTTIYALQNLSLIVEKGDVYGIIGLSGAGKSTLIRALAGLVPISSGRILFHDQDISQMHYDHLRAFRRSIGMIFQHFNLLNSRTVGGNVAYPLEIAGIAPEKQSTRVEELLSLVGLRDKIDSYPLQLSGGEKQRVGIARALANHPEVLFCDEATSALDPKTTKEILALLRSINIKLGVTIVLITHEMAVIKQICNKVAVIDKGTIVERGNIIEVFSNPQHAVTKSLLQTATHEIPAEFLKPASPDRKLLRLTFTGNAATEPLMSEIVRKFDVNTNILLGWIDRLQTESVGTLIVELRGDPAGIASALQFLQKHSVHYEVIENGF